MEPHYIISRREPDDMETYSVFSVVRGGRSEKHARSVNT